MKYSLKNRQFRKRNNIFGQRKKQQTLPDFIIKDLDAIKEMGQESEESKHQIPELNTNRNNRFYQFINFENDASHLPQERARKEYKKYSLEAKPSRHGLSPIHKPILNNPDIRLTQSQVRQSKSFQIDSQTINFCYYPQTKPDQSEEVKKILQKLYKILMKNNDRINQLQILLSDVLQRGQKMIKLFNQGLKTALNLQQQTNLFFNTMRSVYENLRVCKLKQQNLQLYFKQNKESKRINQKQQFFNNMTVKYQKNKFSLSHKKKEQQVYQNQKESRELERLVDYQSDSSLQENCSGDKFTERNLSINTNTQNVFKKPQNQHQFQRFLDPRQLQINSHSPQNIEYSQLSPFEANRIISSSNSSITEKRPSPQFTRSQSKPIVHQSYFSTFRNNIQSQSNLEYEQTKLWLKNTNQIGLRCWLDEMNCLRRMNNTYIFNENGQVMSISGRLFQQLAEEGLIIPVFDNA